MFLHCRVHNNIPTNDICSAPVNGTWMCPLCDDCPMWQLEEACTMYKFRYNWHENFKFKFKLYQAIKISIEELITSGCWQTMILL